MNALPEYFLFLYLQYLWLKLIFSEIESQQPLIAKCNCDATVNKKWLTAD